MLVSFFCRVECCDAWQWASVQPIAVSDRVQIAVSYRVNLAVPNHVHVVLVFFALQGITVQDHSVTCYFACARSVDSVDFVDAYCRCIHICCSCLCVGIDTSLHL